VAAFRATLEELAEADVLLHVVDASQPALDDHLAAVESLLEELEVGDRPTILVLNKMDRVESERALETLMVSRPRVVAVSAATGKGIESLLVAIEAALRPAPAVVAGNSG
jgi:GTP-binding protein HflX